MLINLLVAWDGIFNINLSEWEMKNLSQVMS